MLFLLLLVCGLLAQTGEKNKVPWQDGSPYSSSFLYNGFRYKIIRIFDTKDPEISPSVGVATDSTGNCPGKLRKCTTTLLLVRNEGQRLFDVDPKLFEVACSGKKPHTLGQYSIPRYLRSAIPANFLLLGNTVLPDKGISGAVIFSGTCSKYTVRVPITIAERQLVFEFPFSQ